MAGYYVQMDLAPNRQILNAHQTMFIESFFKKNCFHAVYILTTHLLSPNFFKILPISLPS